MPRNLSVIGITVSAFKKFKSIDPSCGDNDESNESCRRHLGQNWDDLHLNRPHNPSALRCDNNFLEQKDDVVPDWVTLSNANDGEGKQQVKQSFSRTSHEKRLQEVHQDDPHLDLGREVGR